MARSSASVEVRSYPCSAKASMAFFNAASLSNSLGRAIAQSVRDYLLQTLPSIISQINPDSSLATRAGPRLRFVLRSSVPGGGSELTGQVTGDGRQLNDVDLRCQGIGVRGCLCRGRGSKRRLGRV